MSKKPKMTTEERMRKNLLDREARKEAAIQRRKDEQRIRVEKKEQEAEQERLRVEALPPKEKEVELRIRSANQSRRMRGSLMIAAALAASGFSALK